MEPAIIKMNENIEKIANLKADVYERKYNRFITRNDIIKILMLPTITGAVTGLGITIANEIIRKFE